MEQRLSKNVSLRGGARARGRQHVPRSLLTCVFLFVLSLGQKLIVLGTPGLGYGPPGLGLCPAMRERGGGEGACVS